MNKRIYNLVASIFILLFFCLCNVSNVFAKESSIGLSMSPMNQKIILVPGETYYGSFHISVPSTHETGFCYSASANPFYVDDNYNVIYENVGSYSQIIEWVSIISNQEKCLHPGSGADVVFSINVPENAPAGGQYLAINIKNNAKENAEKLEGINLTINQVMTHIVYAEIAGTTERSGEITSIEVPSFMLSGSIGGTSYIKNTGNVHGSATYVLQVFPFFSDEEIYTNEEDPQVKTILPDRTLMNTTSWDNTPDMGIFNVKYTVEFEGITQTVEKMVIKCPIWLLFVIIFGVIFLVFWFTMKSKSRKKSKR